MRPRCEYTWCSMLRPGNIMIWVSTQQRVTFIWSVGWKSGRSGGSPLAAPSLPVGRSAPTPGCVGQQKLRINTPLIRSSVKYDPHRIPRLSGLNLGRNCIICVERVPPSSDFDHAFAAQMQLSVRSTSPSSQAFTKITCAGSEGEILDRQELIRASADLFFICHAQDDTHSRTPLPRDFPLEHLK
jgi:hypothetical protein